jgi:hypothetical protein
VTGSACRSAAAQVAQVVMAHMSREKGMVCMMRGEGMASAARAAAPPAFDRQEQPWETTSVEDIVPKGRP